ncbi:Oidioi.mRNA.OKI2018_I69.XSR.g14907.t1.cds [Oikopleura dioica]|uniref:Oidioi.mRNA.OKI2018_I69.XSR.g14907.t1.cds n=1 Tax=Oikopleura dioica TaxID=34765 RepID=A0ABN7SIH8_OIKDI|nr:Oidioi.mRNA.OKI2018_I69.XSR.g14907.t1.cds [Oikopleura dioica]
MCAQMSTQEIQSEIEEDSSKSTSSPDEGQELCYQMDSAFNSARRSYSASPSFYRTWEADNSSSCSSSRSSCTSSSSPTNSPQLYPDTFPVLHQEVDSRALILQHLAAHINTTSQA